MTLSLWLDNISSCFSLFLGFIILSKLRILLGKHPSQWKKIVLRRKSLFHIHKIHSKKIFSGKSMNTWIIVYFLKKMHFDKCISIDRNISPIYIPITRLHIVLYFPSKILSNIRYNGILSG